MLQTIMNRLPPVASPPPSAGITSQQRSTIPPTTNGSSVTQSSISVPVLQSVQGPGNSTEQKPVTTSPPPCTNTVVRESEQIASTSDRLAPKLQDQPQMHFHHHHHQPSERQKESVPERLSSAADYKSSTREINKELLERLAQVSSSRDDTSALGPLILRKRRSKSRGKGVAPLAPLATQPASPTEATETTQMLEYTDDREMSTERLDRSDRSERSERERQERKRPPRPRDYL